MKLPITTLAVLSLLAAAGIFALATMRSCLWKKW